VSCQPLDALKKNSEVYHATSCSPPDRGARRAAPHLTRSRVRAEFAIGTGFHPARPARVARRASFGVPVVEDEAIPELFTIGINGTQLRPGRLGADFSLATAPRALSEGFLAGVARGGVALPLALSPVVLVLPSAGVSFLGAVGGGGGAGTTGLNAGVAAVFHGAGAAGLRTGVTWHRFVDAERGVWLWEVGLVHVPRSR